MFTISGFFGVLTSGGLLSALVCFVSGLFCVGLTGTKRLVAAIVAVLSGGVSVALFCVAWHIVVSI
jgi:hypothetical protein